VRTLEVLGVFPFSGIRNPNKACQSGMIGYVPEFTKPWKTAGSSDHGRGRMFS
jgi:hypothetical protein